MKYLGSIADPKDLVNKEYVDAVGNNVLKKYTGSAPTSIADLPGNSWWVASGSVLAPIMGDTFTWTLDTTKTYYVRVYQLSNALRRFEVSSSGAITYWTGWKTTATANIAWATILPDSTLSVSGVPADSKAVGDNALLTGGTLAANSNFNDVPTNVSRFYMLGSGDSAHYINAPDDADLQLYGGELNVDVVSGSFTYQKVYVNHSLKMYRRTYNRTNNTWYDWWPIGVDVDATLKNTGDAADAKIVGDNILLKYTGTTPTASITELPDNSWWFVSGSVLQPLLGGGFAWTLTSGSNYIVRKYFLQGSTRRYEVFSAGGTMLWSGWATTGNITWAPQNISNIIDTSESIVLTKNGLTSNGITYTWQANGTCEVSGTATAISACNIVPAADLPVFLHPSARIITGTKSQLIAGDSIEIKYKSNNENVWINLWWSDGNTTTYINVKDSYKILSIPTGTTRWGVRLYVASGTVISTENPAIISNISIRKFCNNTPTGGGILGAKFLGYGHSTTTGSVWVVDGTAQLGARSDHLCPYDCSPYGGIASGLGILKENVDYTLLSDTTFMTDATQTVLGDLCFLNLIKNTDLTPYDYVLAQLGQRDIKLCPLGDLTSVAGDGSVVGGVLDLLDYIQTSNPLCQPIVLSTIPYGVPSSGYDVFTTPITGPGGVTVTVAQMDTLMHQLAEREHFIYIDFQEMWLSYHWHDFTPTPTNVHLNSDMAYRIVSEYLRRKVIEA